MFVEVADIKRALDCDEIVPTFQPQVHLHDGKLVGFEVLARWAHAEQGLILPGNFIALAESTGSIDALTEQVLRKSLAAASSLAEPVTLSVNVSPVQLRDAGLPLLIRRIGEAYRFPFNRLTIEITETALLDNLAEAKSVAAELKAMGCKLSLDDFGTGYSSLHHLRSLPFDELKIDRSFVSSMTSERESRKIVAATVSLGRSLGLTTVGEGVEEASQSGMLTALGCHVGQGWLYGRPQPAERLEETIGMVRAIPMSEIAGGGFDLVSCSLEAMPEQRLAQFSMQTCVM
jgi:EAL domain-containing protein (putative c-di-GMP-specific phosphodiesterase class I)